MYSSVVIVVTTPDMSINRNIVECKGRRNERLGTSGEVLIETSWNVKEKECSQYQFSEEVLIETSWNVKFWKGRRN